MHEAAWPLRDQMMLQVVPIPYQLAAQKKESIPAASVSSHYNRINCGVGTLRFDLLF